MSNFDRFKFISESTPTEEVREFIYEVMLMVGGIKDELRNSILDYMNDEMQDGIRFGLKIAEAERDLKIFLNQVEKIHNFIGRHGGEKKESEVK